VEGALRGESLEWLEEPVDLVGWDDWSGVADGDGCPPAGVALFYGAEQARKEPASSPWWYALELDTPVDGGSARCSHAIAARNQRG
jgi:hypothetical protein